MPTKDRAVKEESKGRDSNARPVRPPITERRILHVPAGLMEEGYKYRFVNTDILGRVEALKERYWEVVTGKSKVSIGDARVDKSDGLGSAYTVSHGGTTLVLMRLAKEYHDEDVAYLQKEIDRQELDMTRSLVSSRTPDKDGFYGEVDIQHKRI